MCYPINKRSATLLSTRATIRFLDRRSKCHDVASFSIVLIKTVKVVVIVFKKIFISCFHGIFCIVL